MAFEYGKKINLYFNCYNGAKSVYRHKHTHTLALAYAHTCTAHARNPKMNLDLLKIKFLGPDAVR